MTFTKKSLAWVELALTDGVFHYTADSVGSSYRIEQKNPFAENATEEDLKWELWDFSQDFGYSRNYDSAEAAKAAAELEHSERLAPFLELVEDGELVEALERIRDMRPGTARLGWSDFDEAQEVVNLALASYKGKGGGE